MKIFILFAALSLFSVSTVFGQGPLVTGCFGIFNAAGQPDTVFCVGDVVNAVNCFPNADINATFYDFGAGAGLGPASSYTYTAPGIYTVEQHGTDNFGVSYLLRKENHIVVVQLPPPVFTVTLCNTNQVLVSITDNNFDQYTVNFGDGSPAVNLGPGATHVHGYASSGTYTITIEGFDIASGCRNTSTQTVTPLAQLPPVTLTRAEVLNQPFASGSTQLIFTAVAGYKYEVSFRPLAGTFQPVGTVTATATGPQVFTHTPVNNVAQGCYQIKVLDECGSAILPVSNELCTITASVNAVNGANQLSWQGYPAVQPAPQQYRLLRNGNPLATLAAGTTTYTDNNVVCGRNYCYTIEAEVAGGFVSASNAACVTAISTQNPPAASLQSSFNLGNTIEVSLYVPPTATFLRMHPFRSLNGGPFVPRPNTSFLVFHDTDTSAATLTYCYRAAYTDSCARRSDTTNITCPILMSAQMQQQPSFLQQVTLNWSAYVGYSQGVRQYAIEVLDASFQVIATTPVGNVLTYIDNAVPAQSQVLFYRIKAIPVNPAEPEVFSNNMRFVQELQFLIPNAFTPNGDNLNDVFEVKGGLFEEYDLQVLNRTGQVVFRSTATTRGWDGTVQGRPVPSDTYIYQFRGSDSFGRTFSRTGTVTLLR